MGRDLALLGAALWAPGAFADGGCQVQRDANRDIARPSDCGIYYGCWRHSAIGPVLLRSRRDSRRNVVKKEQKVQKKKALKISAEPIRFLGYSELNEAAGGSRTFTRTSIDFACQN